MTRNETMTRNKNGQPSATPQPVDQVVTKAAEPLRPKSAKHLSTPDEAKAWAASKELQPPK